MPKQYNPKNTINGTYGEVWIDDYYIAEILGLQAKVKVEKTEVKQAMTLAKGYKVTGIEGSGTVKLNKVTSYFTLKLSGEIKQGKTPVCTIISKLSDPDALGCERIQLNGCTFDELTLVDWEAGKLVEESIPFSFTGWELMDVIAAE